MISLTDRLFQGFFAQGLDGVFDIADFLRRLAWEWTARARTRHQLTESAVRSVMCAVRVGDVYLRALLIHGAHSAIVAAQNKTANTNVWLASLLSRRHPNVAAVALANKNVRTVWALLAHGLEFRTTYVPPQLAT